MGRAAEAGMGPLVVDTCVLVDVLRGRGAALDFLRSLDRAPLVSAITIGELYAGAHRPGEEARISDLATRLRVAAVDFAIASLGGNFVRRFGPGHGVALIDATIAATAHVHGARLVTRNVRHFPMLDDVLVPYQ
jgi:predicted nucleic acid-binding protein